MVQLIALWLAVASGTGAGGHDGHLEQGIQELKAFHARQALEHLQQALAEGPYDFHDHLRLYEYLGIAYAYLDQKEPALEAFAMVLDLDPGFAISYHLSPKVTFLFEEARTAARARPQTGIHLSWPRDLEVADPIPIDIDVSADPRNFLKKVRLQVRLKGAAEFSVREVPLPEPGAFRRVVLPPAAPDNEHAEVLQVGLTCLDEKGNEVYVTRDLREIQLTYRAPEPWYGQWWVWAVTGVVLAAGTGMAVFFSQQDLPDTIPGGLDVSRGFPALPQP